MSSRAYLLDTDIASYLLRRSHPQLEQRLRFLPAETIFLSVISAGELLLGVKAYPLTHRRRGEVTRFIERARVLDWNISAAEAYADIRHSLTSAGNVIGIMDMMIAAHALAADLTLVTNNTRHFERLALLRLENWTES
jgi:tRNA(fMet)-specific endonuclease VapC